VTLASLAAVAVLLVIQINRSDEDVNAFSIALLVLAILLGFAVVAPRAVKEVLDRITTFKVGAVEVGLQAANRVELQQVSTEAVAGVNARDDVGASSKRPVGGGVAREYTAVREKLEERLKFVRETLFGMGESVSCVQVAERMEARGLIAANELQIAYDLLGRAEASIAKLPNEIVSEYLTGAWRFASRFATLVFERQVRKELLAAGWFLLDFEQTRKHRPDFLAHRSWKADPGDPEAETWFVIATRVEATKTKETRGRLERRRMPFGAEPVLVLPDSEGSKRGDPTEKRTKVLTLSELLAFRG
jgi:hypothetical protein